MNPPKISLASGSWVNGIMLNRNGSHVSDLGVVVLHQAWTLAELTIPDPPSGVMLL